MIPELLVCDDLVDQTLAMLTQKLVDTDPSRSRHVVLTGGSAGMSITRKLSQVAKSIPKDVWAATHFWWGDERFVASDHADRNDRDINSALGDYFIESNIHRVTPSDRVADAQSSADRYMHELLNFGVNGSPPQFCFVVLGVGPDGHIASLFPRRPELHSHEIALPVLDSPKPPPVRVTMSYQTLNHSYCTLLLVGGEKKRDALASIMDSRGSIESTPARGIEAVKVYALTDQLFPV
ncbi:MAG: 6-phosphogluconolactonase [Candidatus Nanopelagicales bacterium]|nr:6-phosphogluconolactonase [Candidatus Nanopelagicales bacterium]